MGLGCSDFRERHAHDQPGSGSNRRPRWPKGTHDQSIALDIHSAILPELMNNCADGSPCWPVAL